MNQTFDRELDVALDAVRRAARLCRSVQARVTGGVLSKDDRSPVTIADYGSQALICQTLHAAFPDDPVIAEEDAVALREPANAGLLAQVMQEVRALHAGATEDQVCGWLQRGTTATYSDRFWTLDPIDGTKGFLRGEQYAIALALVVDGEVQVAALACPNLGAHPTAPEAEGTLYAAVRGRGARRYALDGPSDGAPIRAGRQDDPAKARFCESVESAHTAHNTAAAVAGELGVTAEPLRLDSQAKYALVARGDADFYLRLPTRPGYVEKIWDHAAGALVITEAGGRVTDIHGRPLDFRHGRGLNRNQGIVASNGLLHDTILAAVAGQFAMS